jgi:septum formation protein
VPAFVYLASASPRRRELLAQIGIAFEVIEVAVEEIRAPQESPSAYAARMAVAKAEAGWRLRPRAATAPVLGADTDVVVDEVILGKPEGPVAAARMLQHLSGRSHEVYSAVALRHDGGVAVRVHVSRVWFKPLSDADIDAYVASAEPLDKAGAYAIQGRAARFISRLDGSYSGVMGLPLYETAELLAACPSQARP